MSGDPPYPMTGPIDGFVLVDLEEDQIPEGSPFFPGLKTFPLEDRDFPEGPPLIREEYIPPELFDPGMSHRYRDEPEGYLPDPQDLHLTEAVFGGDPDDWPSMRRFQTGSTTEPGSSGISRKQARRYCRIARKLVRNSICELDTLPTIRSARDILEVMLRDVADHPHERSRIESYVDLLDRFIDMSLERS